MKSSKGDRTQKDIAKAANFNHGMGHLQAVFTFLGVAVGASTDPLPLALTADSPSSSGVPLPRSGDAPGAEVGAEPAKAGSYTDASGPGPAAENEPDSPLQTPVAQTSSGCCSQQNEEGECQN